MVNPSKLTALDILHFDKDIRLMSQKELKTNFAAASSGRILLSKLIKNIIWQAYQRIQQGSEPPIEGNIRTFWYLWVKPVLSRFSSDNDAKTDPYDVLTQHFSQMVLTHKLFAYKDFDFTDENWENRRVGITRPDILVFAEKTGWIRFLRELNQEFDCSIIALGGAPSALSSEYTANHIFKSLPSPETPLKLFGIVDFDPSGHIIAQAFQNQLASCGLDKSNLTLLIDPKRYSKKEIEIFKFPLPKTQKTKLASWLKQTGGIDGLPFGLESESMPKHRLKSLITQLIVDYQSSSFI